MWLPDQSSRGYNFAILSNASNQSDSSNSYGQSVPPVNHATNEATLYQVARKANYPSQHLTRPSTESLYGHHMAATSHYLPTSTPFLSHLPALGTGINPGQPRLNQPHLPGSATAGRPTRYNSSALIEPTSYHNNYTAALAASKHAGHKVVGSSGGNLSPASMHQLSASLQTMSTQPDSVAPAFNNFSVPFQYSTPGLAAQPGNVNAGHLGGVPAHTFMSVPSGVADNAIRDQWNRKQYSSSSPSIPSSIASSVASSQAGFLSKPGRTIESLGRSNWPTSSETANDIYRLGYDPDRRIKENNCWPEIDNLSAGRSFLPPGSKRLSPCINNFSVAASNGGRSSVSPASTGSSAMSDLGPSSGPASSDGCVSNGWRTPVKDVRLLNAKNASSEPAPAIGTVNGSAEPSSGDRSFVGVEPVGCFGFGDIGSWLEAYLAESTRAKLASSNTNGFSSEIENGRSLTTAKKEARPNKENLAVASGQESEFIFYSDEEEDGPRHSAHSTTSKGNASVMDKITKDNSIGESNNSFAFRSPFGLGWSGAVGSGTISKPASIKASSAAATTTATWSQIAAKKPPETAMRNATGTPTSAAAGSSSSASVKFASRCGSPSSPTASLPPPEYHRGPKVDPRWPINQQIFLGPIPATVSWEEVRSCFIARIGKTHILHTYVQSKSVNEFVYGQIVLDKPTLVNKFVKEGLIKVSGQYIQMSPMKESYSKSDKKF